MNPFTYILVLIFWILAYLTVPIFIVIREIIGLILQFKYKSKFKGFLAGEDLIWKLTGNSSRGHNTSFFYVKIDKKDFNEFSQENILSELRERFREILLSRKIPKLFYKVQVELNFWFYLDDNPGPVEKYIRTWDFGNEKEFIEEKKLRKCISEVSNSSLPENDARSWEILVGSQPVDMEDSVKFPILFRVSHALADGVAVTRFQQEILADHHTSSMWTKNTESKPQKLKNISLIDKLITGSLQIFDILALVLTAPHKITMDLFLREIDVNSIHPKELCGEKICDWIHENDMELPLLEVIKNYRRKHPEFRYNHVISAIIGKGLSRYFSLTNEKSPEHVTVFCPDRIKPPNKKLELSNTFAIVQYIVPIMGEFETFEQLLRRAKSLFPDLRHDKSLFVRVFTISLLRFWPVFLVEKVGQLKHSSMVMSAFPGPDEPLKVCGREWNDLTILAPNMGNNGLSILINAYCGKLNIGVLADKASINSEEKVALLLKSIIEVIGELKNDK